MAGRPKGSKNTELTIPQRASQVDLAELIEQDAWDRLPGEPLDHFNIFTEYRLLGLNRTLRNTYRVVMSKQGKNADSTITSATSYSTLAKMWHWEERAASWDRYNLALQEEARSEVFQKGLALDYERVKMLIEHAEILDRTNKRNKYPDFRTIEQLRGVLDDIAREVGGRQPIKATTNTQVNLVLETQWGRGGSASTAWNEEVTVVEAETKEVEE